LIGLRGAVPSAVCSFAVSYRTVISFAEADIDLARITAHKLFNLARGNKCPPSGGTRQIANGSRFMH
jgi:hypothetical protein